MKKLFFILAGLSISASSFTQADQWTLTPNNLKNATGRLMLNFPDSSSWSVHIYKMPGNISIKSILQTDHIASFPLLPGNYRILLNKVPVLSTPVEKGHDTRIRHGILTIAEKKWVLVDETGNTNFLSGNKPGTLVLPVGKYIVKAGGQSKIVTVNETNEENPKTVVPDDGSIETEQYSMTPIAASLDDLPQHSGIFLPPQLASGGVLPVYREVELYKAGISVFRCGNCPLTALPCPPTHTIAVGGYDIQYRGVYNEQTGVITSCIDCKPIIIWNIPIRYGYKTRLKMGYLKHLAPGLYQVFDESN